MQLSHAMTDLETAVEAQLRIAGPEIAETGAQLMAALRPAIRQTLLDVVSMAVTEISSQLEAQSIDIKLVDGEPELVVREDSGTHAPPPIPPHGTDDGDEARITLRLPGYLKELISDEAERAGDSINSYLVELLSRKARRRPLGSETRTTLEL